MPKYLRSFVVYRFICPGCNASHIGETTRHLTMRIKEHLETDSKSQIFKHLDTNKNYEALCNTECFEIIDSWEKPSLNKQVKYVSISITILNFFHRFIVIAFTIM